MINCAFPKHSRLCGQERITALYKSGHRFVAWPLRVTWMPAEDTQILVWAPQSLFKHAVDRNHLRRLMREAYRLNQHLLQAQPVLQRSDPTGEAGQQSYLIAFNYIDKERQPYAVIERAVIKALKKISKDEE